MADRISALEAEKASLESLLSTSGKPPAPRQPSAEPSSNDAGVLQLKQDLAEALRSKGVTETRLRSAEDELTKLRTKTKTDSKSIRDLSADRATLTTRLKDRDYELREKRKLIEVRTTAEYALLDRTVWETDAPGIFQQVQDEMIALNLQMSMAEKERDKFKKENKELIDRWMKRKAQEADAMNLANEPIFERGR